MTTKIVSDQEVREALSGSENLAKGREWVMEELGALRDWFHFAEAREQGTLRELPFSAEFVEALLMDGLRYPLERLDEIEAEIAGWPKPITREELV